jgi:predicted transcriptional regulator
MATKHWNHLITSIILRPDQLEWLDELAQKHRRTRSWMLREILDKAKQFPFILHPDEAA